VDRDVHLCVAKHESYRPPNQGWISIRQSIQPYSTGSLTNDYTDVLNSSVEGGDLHLKGLPCRDVEREAWRLLVDFLQCMQISLYMLHAEVVE